MSPDQPVPDQPVPEGAPPERRPIDLVERLKRRVESAMHMEAEMLGGLVSPMTDQATRTFLQAAKELGGLAPSGAATPRPRESLADMEARLTGMLVDGEGL